MAPDLVAADVIHIIQTFGPFVKYHVKELTLILIASLTQGYVHGHNTACLIVIRINTMMTSTISVLTSPMQVPMPLMC